MSRVTLANAVLDREAVRPALFHLLEAGERERALEVARGRALGARGQPTTARRARSGRGGNAGARGQLAAPEHADCPFRSGVR